MSQMASAIRRNVSLATKRDTIPLGILGQRIDLVIVSTNPSNVPVIIARYTKITTSEEQPQQVSSASGR